MMWAFILLMAVGLALFVSLKRRGRSDADRPYAAYYKSQDILYKNYNYQIDRKQSSVKLLDKVERLSGSGSAGSAQTEHTKQSVTIASSIKRDKPAVLTSPMVQALAEEGVQTQEAAQTVQAGDNNSPQPTAAEANDKQEIEVTMQQEAEQEVTEESGMIEAKEAQEVPEAVSETVAIAETEQGAEPPEGLQLDENGQPISRLAQYQEQHQAQEEMPIALVQDEPLSVLPKDLYIPPEALMVILEAFEGPLDLLLYLIRRQNLDVLDIPIAEITKQYMGYIALMEELDLEVAAEYLVMAAMLAEIKSRMLLPRPEEEEDEDDPRAELVRRLQEYERFKKAAVDIDELPRMERNTFQASAEPPEIERRAPEPDVDLKELLIAFQEVLQRADMFTSHQIKREPLSVRERMTRLLAAVSENDEGFTDFSSLFTAEEGRMGVVVTFLAVLELVKEKVIDFVQSEPFAPIYLKPAGSDLEVPASNSSEFD